MPARLLEDPLGIDCVFSDGRRLRHVLGDPDPAALVRDLLTGLAAMVHPHGTVDSPGTVHSYLTGLRDLAGFLRERAVRGGAGVLTRGLLAEYWMQADRLRESTTRRMLAALDTVGGGVLQPGVRALVDGRHFTPTQRSSPLVPYTEQEWQRLHQVCRRMVDEAFTAHRRASVAAARGQDPREGGWDEDNRRWLLRRLGPSSDRQIGEYLSCDGSWVQKRGGIRTASDELFPDVNVVIAYRLLLGMYSGIVPDGIADLGVGDIDWAGDATVLLSYVKGRTAAESLTLPGRAVRLLEQWLVHSALVRGHAPAGLRGSLWLYYGYSGRSRWLATPSVSTQQLWARQQGLGSLDRRRIRTTYLSLRDRARWHGSTRSVIDPNHTPAVEGDHYLTAATPAQADAVETIIEDAQQDLLRRALPPVILPAGDAAEVAGRYPELVSQLRLDDAAVGELVGGGQDVFVAACADPLSGLHGPPGKPCPARPWVCLLCPLAVFAPRHAANLLRLRAFFTRQWKQMPSGQFMAVFGPYSTRIQQILDRYPDGLLAAAARSLPDTDDSDGGMPLRPEERTT
jgi:hypothetical protein